MSYVCYLCSRNITVEDIAKRTRCPYCGGKILFKERAEVVKRVKAR
jgi:DNA-directed RNA polymerase subunit RPC12/RpoP